MADPSRFKQTNVADNEKEKFEVGEDGKIVVRTIEKNKETNVDEKELLLEQKETNRLLKCLLEQARFITGLGDD